MVTHGFHDHRALAADASGPDYFPNGFQALNILSNIVVILPAFLCFIRRYWFESVYFLAVGFCSAIYHMCLAVTDKEYCLSQDTTIFSHLDFSLALNGINMTFFHVVFRTETIVISLTLATNCLSTILLHKVQLLK